ncbi:MAG: 4Fe-4S binding protein [Rhodocyclales bacterium]|nr:4Fe-4S binding protein [Rhodocyclales bacterium]
MPPCSHRLWQALLCALLMLVGMPHLAQASLSKADIERRFGPPLHVESKLNDPPVWPLRSELEPEGGPVGYVFESIDLAPIPGFEGTPMNFLVAIDRKGNFLDVELLHQHEPVFLGGLGEAPLREFIGQYAGHNLKRQFLIALNAESNRSGASQARASQVVLDGVAKATASVRIVNQSVLGAALAVARSKLGFSAPGQHGPAAQVRHDLTEQPDFSAMLKNGMVGHARLSNREAEALFADSEAAGLDEEALAKPDAPFVDLYIAYLNSPVIGRALLGDAQYEAVLARNFDNRHLWWIASSGRYAIVDENFVPGSQPARLALEQGGLMLELRDQGFEVGRTSGPESLLNTSRIFGVYAEAGLDPAQAQQLTLTLTRAKGMILPSLTHRNLTLNYTPPKHLFIYPPKPLPEWLLAWRMRWLDLLVISAALLLLSVILLRPRRIAQDERSLHYFRQGFLAFTLIYLGWYAQGQLSIVQITGALKTLKAGQGLGSYLYDPVSLLIIAFTLISFVVWGRGTFCGWLCPFGALQEFVGRLAHALRLPQLRVPLTLAKRLEHGRYLTLTLLLAAAWFAPQQGEWLNEVEPFKTAITVGFERSWPYAAWASALLLAGAFYFKAFCRFLCPLGGAMSLGGRLRRWRWLSRRNECGQPCQRCKVVCAYDAIEPSGAIRYDACFQCLDCVGIYHDPQRCVPIMLFDKKGRSLNKTPAEPSSTSNDKH